MQKIVKKTLVLETTPRTCELTTSDKEWCKVVIDGAEGSWEWMENVDDDESYYKGGLWILYRHVEEFDGIYELPELVKKAIRHLKVNTSLL